jgi:hypothetical protein
MNRSAAEEFKLLFKRNSDGSVRPEEDNKCLDRPT